MKLLNHYSTNLTILLCFIHILNIDLAMLNNIEVNSGSKLIVVLLMLINKINLVKMIMSIKIGNMNVN